MEGIFRQFSSSIPMINGRHDFAEIFILLGDSLFDLPFYPLEWMPDVFEKTVFWAIKEISDILFLTTQSLGTIKLFLFWKRHHSLTVAQLLPKFQLINNTKFWIINLDMTLSYFSNVFWSLLSCSIKCKVWDIDRKKS